MNIGAKFYSFNDVARLENGQVVVAWPTHIDADGTHSYTFEMFEEQIGVPVDFLVEWAEQGYPLLYNGAMYQPIAHGRIADNAVIGYQGYFVMFHATTFNFDTEGTVKIVLDTTTQNVHVIAE